MDLNKNGIVSPSEADYISSSGKRDIIVNGKKCYNKARHNCTASCAGLAHSSLACSCAR